MNAHPSRRVLLEEVVTTMVDKARVVAEVGVEPARNVAKTGITSQEGQGLLLRGKAPRGRGENWKPPPCT